ncbi:hypothetical protein AgCh_025947 [Apium graveolens]
MVLQSEDGDIIDCIDILKQPAFSHPALKNHTILMKPNNDPKKKSAESETTHWTRKENIERNIVTSQVWHRKGITCPNGTVPIRRVQEFNNFPKNKHGRKNLTYHQLMQSTDTVNLMLANHSTAVLIAEGYSYTAGKGDMVVWNPNVESDDEYSTFSCITQKWSSARADSSKKTGCFDQTCPGFVQTNSKIALGAAIHPISGPNGLPYKISIYIYKGIGHLSYSKCYGIKLIWLNGEVKFIVQELEQFIHTQQPQWEVASIQTLLVTGSRQAKLQENGHELKFPEYVFAYSEEYDCYDQIYVSEYIEDPEFYYGGPGRSWKCP